MGLQRSTYRTAQIHYALYLGLCDGSPGLCSGLHLPRQARPTLSIVLCVAWCQHGGPEEALAVLVAPAYLVASFGKLLSWAGDTAVVLVFGTIAARLGEVDRARAVGEQCLLQALASPAPSPSSLPACFVPELSSVGS